MMTHTGAGIAVVGLLVLLHCFQAAVAESNCITTHDNVIKCTSFSAHEIKTAFDGNKDAIGLDLSNVHISVLKPTAFQHVPNIRELYLDNARVDHVMEDAFKHLRDLQLLSLQNLESDWSSVVESIVRQPIAEVDISKNFAVCSCDHWHAYFQISSSGTRIRNSTEHHCSMKDIATCLSLMSANADEEDASGDTRDVDDKDEEDDEEAIDDQEEVDDDEAVDDQEAVEPSAAGRWPAG